MAYSWSADEVLRGLMGLAFDSRKSENKLNCPVCNHRAFLMKGAGYGHCAACDWSADYAGYYAKANGYSLQDARSELDRIFNIDPDAWKSNPVKRERVVYNTQPVEEVEEETLSDDELDKVYTAFLNTLPVSERTFQEMNDRCGCSKAQLTIWNYRTWLTHKERNPFETTRMLVRQGISLDKAPGFFRAKGGEGDPMYFDQTPGTITPCRNYRNKIVGLMNRKFSEKLKWIEYENGEGDWEAKYTHFSSKGKPCGAAAKCNVHYSCDWKCDDNGEYHPIMRSTIILTEGYMKADIIHYFMPTFAVLAIPGVNNTAPLKKELERVKGYGVDTVMLAFDMDYKHNEAVKKALGKTTEMIKSVGLNVEVAEWMSEDIPDYPGITLKGLDDYLAFHRAGIVPKPKKLIEKKAEEIAEKKEALANVG